MAAAQPDVGLQEQFVAVKWPTTRIADKSTSNRSV
jgi:hypothetical protein